ncbi:MAG: DUF4416 family protein [Endomicrobium sp.]|jgi:hypothetical protein|nr:DUF4416 family protein [Endomicrobium sp.]
MIQCGAVLDTSFVFRGGMGIISNPEKAKLFCGVIYCDEVVRRKSFIMLEEKLGKIDLTSNVVNFDFSNYYNPEMGNGLRRFWISFEELISVDRLAKIKIFTNFTENSFALDGRRQINIDSGYVSLANIILATTKNYSHRVYISSGIYAEVTMMYKKGRFVKLPWTYPDYLSKTATEFLLKVRSCLAMQLKEES